jgi:ABC-2 type transport system ATP-binding protein
VLLQLRSVVKSFGTRRAVDGVTLSVAAGEAVLLVGRNGAGKTTLLRVATGYLDADAGDVVVDGSDMARTRAPAQKKLGYLPEHAPAPPELSVTEWLRARAQLKGAANVAEVIEAADLKSVARQRVATLSKGFRQRVGLADALLGAPRLLVLDEPTSGMDPIQVRELRERLAAIVGSDRGVLVSSHAVADLEALATRVVVMREGRIVADAPVAELRGAGTLDAAVVAIMGAG